MGIADIFIKACDYSAKKFEENTDKFERTASNYGGMSEEQAEKVCERRKLIEKYNDKREETMTKINNMK